MNPGESEQSRWFAEEVQPHESSLRSYLRGLFPSVRDTDDLIQDSYARLLRAREGGKVRCAKAFLFVTARNAAINLLRRRLVIHVGGTEEIDRLPAWDERRGVAETISREHDLALLTEAIEALPRRCRIVFKLRKIDGLSMQEIAARLNISEHTVSAQVGNGVRRCAEYLRAHGVVMGKRHAKAIRHPLD